MFYSRRSGRTASPTLLFIATLIWLLTACGGQPEPTPVPVAIEPPTISEPKISAPTPQEPGQEIGISVDVSSASGVSLTYEWQADGGDIVRGDGSPAITYRTPAEPGIYNVRVTVKWDTSSVEKVTTIRVEAPAVASVDEPPTDTPTPEPDEPSPTATAPPPTVTHEPTATRVLATTTLMPTATPPPSPAPESPVSESDSTQTQNGILFQDDFQDGKADGWTGMSGDWSVVRESDGNFVYQGKGLEYWAFNFPVDSSLNLHNHAFETRFKVVQVSNRSLDQASDGSVSIRGYFNEETNCYERYETYFDTVGNRVMTARIGDGSDCPYTEIAEVNYDLEPNQWYTMRFEAKESTLRVYVDGYFLFETQDEAFTTGKPEILAAREAIVQFDDISVVALGQ